MRTVIQPNKVYKINQPSMTDCEKLKQVIQAANPEITELKFGCEVIRLLRNKRIISLQPYAVEWRLKMLDIGSGVVEDWMSPIHVIKEDLEVLGRPIRLADVLLALGASARVGDWNADRVGTTQANFVVRYGGGNSGVFFWNLKDDNLDHQSDECKEFLIKLLVNEA